jgi:hypothetical protein
MRLGIESRTGNLVSGKYFSITVKWYRAQLIRRALLLEADVSELLLPGHADFWRWSGRLRTSFGTVPIKLRPNRGFPNYTIQSSALESDWSAYSHFHFSFLNLTKEKKQKQINQNLSGYYMYHVL